MQLNEFQEECKKTANHPQGWVYLVLGIAGESGEIVEEFKKCLRDNNGEITQELKNAVALEMGDLLWYISSLCSELGISFEEVAVQNIKKCLDRQKRNVIGGKGNYR